MAKEKNLETGISIKNKRMIQNKNVDVFPDKLCLTFKRTNYSSDLEYRNVLKSLNEFTFQFPLVEVRQKFGLISDMTFFEYQISFRDKTKLFWPPPENITPKFLKDRERLIDKLSNTFNDYVKKLNCEITTKPNIELTEEEKEQLMIEYWTEYSETTNYQKGKANVEYWKEQFRIKKENIKPETE